MEETYIRFLQLTVSLPLKIGLLPQKEMNHLNHPSIFRDDVFFREGTLQGNKSISYRNVAWLTGKGIISIVPWRLDEEPKK